MINQSKYEYLQDLRFRYDGATKQQKQAMLDEFCTVCGYNRKYAIRLLNARQPARNRTNLSKRGRKKIYGDPLIVQVLRDLWIATNLPCAKNLNAIQHIENKNRTHIRQYLGYQRFQIPSLVDKLNDLYTTEWNLYFNFFILLANLFQR